MISIFWHGSARRAALPPWNDGAPIRQELFGVERLEQHAMSLAANQPVTRTPPAVLSLHKRLNDNAVVLLAAYRASEAELERGRTVVPAAEWLLDNYHLVEEQVREIRDDLPPGYYRQLPKLAEGPFAGYPRVFGIAWAFIAHTDSNFDPAILRRFIAAYQRVQPLTIGELWAIAITLRIVLIENLRRLSDQIMTGRAERADADALGDRLAVSGNAQSALEADISARPSGPLPERFAAQLARRLRNQDPRTTPALGWLEKRLGVQSVSIDDVVRHAQQRQGASNVTVRNAITSMRLISDIDWADLFESVSLVDECLCEQSDFSAMDFSTRNLYRSAIEQLARGSSFSELDIAKQVLISVREARALAVDSVHAERVGDPGYHLIAEGRRHLERAIGFRVPMALRIQRYHIGLSISGYIGAIALTTAMLLALALWTMWYPGLGREWLVLLAVLGAVPATEVAIAALNRLVSSHFGAMALPALELTAGVPQSLRTLVAVPTLLTTSADLLEQVEQLEVRHLSGAGGDLVFLLLLDGSDADSEVLESDGPLLAVASQAIAQLNHRHGPSPAGNRFLLLYRRRVFNGGESKWMGWERKRGKLHELNRLLRGASDTTFIPVGGQPPCVPDGVRYVVTLDADTRLPRDAVLKLIGKMAHPLNRPRFDASTQRIVDGYAILQPRVTPALPIGREGSLYQRVFSSPGGMDPYAAAVSDVYQDLFGEGSYTGKGIYDVDAFEAALRGRIPDSTLLSHDLFEGIFARAGLASDVEVVEDTPSRYDVTSRRQHRWTRGDWQLLPWIIGHWERRAAVSPVGRWKMLDNLRRSLVGPASLAALAVCWLLPLPAALVGTLFVVATVAIPAFLPSLFAVLPRRSDVHFRRHIGSLGADVRLAFIQTALSVIFLADHAWRMTDAIVRTLVRLFSTRRHLLEWTTAAQSALRPRLDLAGFYRQMRGGTLLGLLAAAGVLAANPACWPLVLPFAILWAIAPAVALWVSRSPSTRRKLTLPLGSQDDLRLIARRTWRFFETFVTPAENMLPPDNFQEDPKPVVAHRTSPTNIGLYLLSAVAARDFGWAGTTRTVERIEATLGVMEKLGRFKGHFFNWYGTQDLRALAPPYISAVDSGNLAGHLLVLANACDAWADACAAPNARVGLTDHLRLAREAIQLTPGTAGEREQPLLSILGEFEVSLAGPQALEAMLPALKRLGEKAVKAVHTLLPAIEGERLPDLVYWVEALSRSAAEHNHDLSEPGDRLGARLSALAETAREMTMAMDFAFLLDPDRKLLSIGYSLHDNKLDVSCYDLLASEARLASFFAIAKGDVPTQHWLRLGRSALPLANGSALISWSGSMFEYLMPSLVMRAPVGSLLEQTSHLIVERQITYGRTLGIPWGISESAYNARDMEFTYQYSNFGVPGLGLKRGLSDNVVIAPYATGLATMVHPVEALENYRRLAAMGALGHYGFYEALDFTRDRVPDGDDYAVVRSYMAHHQGMTIVAIANTLHNGEMRSRFHSEPLIQASELLLQERMPRDILVEHPRVRRAGMSPFLAANAPTARHHKPLEGAPVTHMLSNGRYAVMLTASGGGYSRWRDIAITRWKEDATRDNWGSFVFLRDIQRGIAWSATTPAPGDDALRDVIFSEDHAEFIHDKGTLTTTMDVIVSGEDDSEVRRLSLSNSGRRPREIELTSYAELVLATPATDNAHPAFAKMFVVTEYLAEFGALVATRRLRAPTETAVWAAHFLVVEGEIAADLQYETDRARFFDNGRSAGIGAALAGGQPLSNTVGTVLDPIFSLRHRVTIAPGRVARLAFWTVVASSRMELLELIDTHHDRSAYDRAKTLAWTQAQVQLRHLAVATEEAADFQRLAAPLLYADTRFRATSATVMRGAGAQSGLWPHSISGDLPILLSRIDDVEDIPQVRQLLRAHEYWRMKGLGVDLVILNDRASSYIQDLQSAIETAVRSSQSRWSEVAAHGSVYALRADLMSAEARALLESVARVTLVARQGTISDHLARMAIAPVTALTTPRRTAPVPGTGPALAVEELEFFNGLGGFDNNGREYVTVLENGRPTPAPWINVIANPGFGFQVSARGGGYTWAENSKENQITAWSNDPVMDPAGDTLYVRDEATGEVWTATAQPMQDPGKYVARHGYGYSRFEHEANGIALDLLQYVPLADPIKISRLTLRNLSSGTRRLSVTSYAEWVLGTSRQASAPFIVSEMDDDTGAMLARNPWSLAFAGRVAFSDLDGRQIAWTSDRTEFLGHGGGPEAPAALMNRTPLSGRMGAGFDPCAALQGVLELTPGASVEIVAFIGQCQSAEAARALIVRYRQADLDAVLDEVTSHWQSVLGAVQVSTPDRSMDIMLNGWLLYQTLACRVWARSAFYQASGAYGFRDQLQDGMALTLTRPQETRKHLLRAAARQFVEGDVQHWWLPHSGAGVRTRISDDRVWLAFAVASYIKTCGDTAVLDETVSFLDGPLLKPGENDTLFLPLTANRSASLFEHCALGLDQSIALTGEHGLPLMGAGDWNDGMNRVGAGGKGESVWLGWLLVRAIALFAPLAEVRDPLRVRRWLAHSVKLQQALDHEAWDGDWYRRATFDNGTWLGSAQNDECRIDSIAQSWAVLSGAADTLRAETAMAALDRHLIRRDEGLALLFTPPFDHTDQDPGYIRGYPPGLRENGGQYSHAAMWAILAYAKLGQGEKAAELFHMLNPINHARSAAQVQRYKVEPYVVAADVYSAAPHQGRGGWTWYTGSAGWMYQAGVQGMLGIRREGDFLVIDPCVPAAWPGFSARVSIADTHYVIQVDMPSGRCRGVSRALLDGMEIPAADGCVRVPLDRAMHRLAISI